MPVGLESLPKEQGIADGKPVGGQGSFAVPVQVRGAEVELAAYAGANQPDLSAGLKPLVAEHGISDLKPVGGQGRFAVPVQVRAPEDELPPDAGARQA